MTNSHEEATQCESRMPVEQNIVLAVPRVEVTLDSGMVELCEYCAGLFYVQS